jgi:spore germination cell wall hydrolase CwlJ-like protein
LSIVLSLTILYSFYSLSDFFVTYPFKVAYNRLSTQAQKEVLCLADNIYFESATEPREGQIAVAYVTMNRVNSGIFENDICGVVKQKINGVCQFSWWCEDKPYSISNSKVLTEGRNIVYNDVMQLAIYFYVNHEKMIDPTNGALFYHADYVSPGWKNVKKSVQIGRHIFYHKVKT